MSVCVLAKFVRARDIRVAAGISDEGDDDMRFVILGVDHDTVSQSRVPYRAEL